MAISGKKIATILEQLSQEIILGASNYQIAKSLSRSLMEKQLTSARNLFIQVSDACLREALLSLAKLAISEKESVTIEYLLNCASQGPKAFRYATRQEIEISVVEHRKRLENLKTFTNSLKALRDRVLAHLDRKHINEPTAVVTLPFDEVQIETCFDIFLEIINHYRTCFGDTEIDLELIAEEIENELFNLFRILDRQT